MDGWGWWVFWGVLLIVVPIVILGWLAIVLVRRAIRDLDEAGSPAVAKLAAQYAARQALRPEASAEQVLRHVIHQQALRCALIGFLTGLAGIFVLPVALPIDLYTSLRIQMTLVHFIADQYGGSVKSENEVRLRSYLVMTGSRAASDWLVKLVLTLAGKSLAKTVPVLGAFISAGVNYLIAQMVGHGAIQWYSGNLVRQASAVTRRLGGPGGRP